MDDEDFDLDDYDDFDDAYCDICGDTGPWVNTETGLCEMCWDQHGDEDDDDDDAY